MSGRSPEDVGQEVASMRIRRIMVPLALLSIATVAAAQAPVRFEPVFQWQLDVDGSADPSTRFFQSRQMAAVLMVADSLPSPVLLNQRTQTVQEVPLMRLAPQSDGQIALTRGEELATVSRYAVGEEGLTFAYAGRSVRLALKPPLVGEQTAAALFAHSPQYRTKAAGYAPDQAALAKIRDAGNGVRVLVVFASWCHVCSEFLPRGLKMEEALAGGPVRFEYLGLPTDPWEGPVVKRYGVSSLPTAIVYRGEREIGRYIGAEGWTRPEAQLLRAIQAGGD